MKKQDLPKEFESIHKILGKAMREVDRSVWPVRPHFGGPLPVLSTATQLAVAVEVCDAFRSQVGAADLEAYDVRAALARRIDTGERIPYKDIDKLSSTTKTDAPALRVAKQTLRAALNHLYAASSARNACGMCVENAAVTAVKFHIAIGPESASGFLRFVDEAIMRCELRAILKERAIEPSSPIARVVSRPKGSQKGIALVMARLSDESFGLLVKLKQRWQWHEGNRESVFATVPDEFMRLVMADLDPGFKRTQA